MRESNSHQRFWRPLSYHLTNPLSKPTCKISFTVAIIHIKATIVKLIVHFYYKEFYKERAEMEGFEPSHRLPGLPHFECGPFSHLVHLRMLSELFCSFRENLYYYIRYPKKGQSFLKLFFFVLLTNLPDYNMIMR